MLDVTAEFDSLNWTLLGEDIDYLNVPILDHSVPTEIQVKRALNWIHTHRKDGRSVVVHCALGRGRSVFMLVAYLLSQHPDKTPAAIIKHIKGIRPSAHLNKRQLHVITSSNKQPTNSRLAQCLTSTNVFLVFLMLSKCAISRIKMGISSA